MTTSTNYRQRQIILLILLSILYCIVFYFITTDQLRLDFSSFYSASSTLSQHENPYQVLRTTYFPTVKYLSPNPNPPCLLMLFIPLSKINYHISVIIWCCLSLILSLITATTAFKLAVSQSCFKQHKITALIIYFSLFSTMIDTETMQLGSFTAFFLIIGYYCYRKNRSFLASVLWGVIISLKIFPFLLFFYVLQQRQYKMLGIMLTTMVIMWLIPWFIYDSQIYSDYFKLLPHMLWFGDNWNASLYGFLFRLFVDGYEKKPDLMLVQSIYGLLSIAGLIWYLKSMNSAHDTYQQPFCLTLVMMLLISPMGWIYYFPILYFPLLITWSQSRINKPFTWLLCLFLINFPMGYVMLKNMATIFEKLTLYSFPFYGLLLLIYLLSINHRTEYQEHNDSSNNLESAIGSILAFGIIIVSLSFIWRFQNQ